MFFTSSRDISKDSINVSVGNKNKNASSESSSPHCVGHSDFFKTNFVLQIRQFFWFTLTAQACCKPTQNNEGKFMVKNMRRLQFCPILFAYMTLVTCIAQDQQSTCKYSCNNITTTLIQISRLFYFGFFSKTNHQMII